MYAEGVNIKGRVIPLIDTLASTSTSTSTSTASSALFQETFNRTINRLTDSGKKIVILGPVPAIGWDVPTVLERTVAYGRSVPKGVSIVDFLERQGVVLQIFQNLDNHSLVDVHFPHSELCGTDSCPVQDNGKPLYFDSNHLSLYGASLVLSPLLPNLNGSQNN